MFIEKLREFSQNNLVEYGENQSLAAISTFKIGGTCDVLIYPKCAEGLFKVIELAKSTGTPFAVFGRCSNVLFSDYGYRGAIICTTKMKSIKKEGDLIVAECGVLLNDLARYCMTEGLSGMEFGYGIPGTVGGACYMNAGAYEHSVSEVLTGCKYYSIKEDKVYSLTNDEMKLSYRHSVFSGDEDKIILEASFRFGSGEPAEIKAQMDDYMGRRRSKQPLEYPSAGSVFKRCEGYFTGKLIQDLGLKGYSVGGAMISPKHAGFIINYENATAEDVKKLIDEIIQKVHDEYGLTLQREVIYFGD